MPSPQIRAEIIADDRTKGVFEAVAANARKAMTSAAGSQAAMSREFIAAQTAFTRAQLAHADAIARANGGYKQMLGLVQAMAAYKVGEIAFQGVKEGASIQNQTLAAAAAGMSPEDANKLASQAADIAVKVPTLLRSEIIKTGSELRASLVDASEMPTLLPTLAQAQAVLRTAGHGEAAEQMIQFVKGAEQLNLTKNAEQFATATNHFVQAAQFFQGLLTPETWRKSVAAAGIAGQGWSEHFRDYVFPSLVAEQGERAGTGLNAINKLLTSGFTNNKAALKEFVRLGLVDAQDVDERHGQLSLKAGRHVHDVDLAITDPDKYLRDVLAPAMRALGIKSDQETIAELRRLFPNGTAAQEAAKIINQLDLLHKDEAGIRSAAGLNTDVLARATEAFAALTKQAVEFGGTLTTPAMGPAATAMGGLATQLARVNDWLAHWSDEHRDVAPWASGAAIGVGGLAGLGAVTAILRRLTGAAEIAKSAAAMERAAAAMASLGGGAEALSAAAATAAPSFAALATAVGGAAAVLGNIGFGVKLAVQHPDWARNASIAPDIPGVPTYFTPDDPDRGRYGHGLPAPDYDLNRMMGRGLPPDHVGRERQVLLDMRLADALRKSLSGEDSIYAPGPPLAPPLDIRPEAQRRGTENIDVQGEVSGKVENICHIELGFGDLLAGFKSMMINFETEVAGKLDTGHGMSGSNAPTRSSPVYSLRSGYNP